MEYAGNFLQEFSFGRLAVGRASGYRSLTKSIGAFTMWEPKIGISQRKKVHASINVFTTTVSSKMCKCHELV